MDPYNTFVVYNGVKENKFENILLIDSGVTNLNNYLTPCVIKKKKNNFLSMYPPF